MGNVEVIQRLRRLLKTYTLVVLSDNAIVFCSKESTIAPLISALDTLAEGLKGKILGDRVVGKAAALIMVIQPPKFVYAQVISSPAVMILERYDVRYAYGRIVRNILTKEGDICPFERAVMGIDDPNVAFHSG